VNVLDKCRLSKPFTRKLHKLYLDALLNSEEYDAFYTHLTNQNLTGLTKGDQHFYKGVYYYHSKNYNDALSQFKYALELETGDSRVYYYLGKIHLELGNMRESKKMFDIFKDKTERPELEDVQLRDMEETEL
jgi:tetratricopeptide (TPR) repeat protein